MFLIVVCLFVWALFGAIFSAWRRGWPWLIPIPVVLALLALNGSSSGPLPTWIRYLAAFGIPVGIALPLLLPPRPKSRRSSIEQNPDGEPGRDARALALGWLAVLLSLIWTWYLLADPSSCLGGGGCG